MTDRRGVVVLYGLGVLFASAAGFFSPWWYLGFIPLAAGLVWAAYDLVEVNSGDTPRAAPIPRP